MIQLIQNALKLVSKSQNQRNREEMEENGAKIEALESLKNPKSRQTSRSVWSDWLLGQRFDFSIFAYFLILWSSSCHFQLKFQIFYA